MFVGITRARQELQISTARYRDFRGQRKLTIPSSFLMELPRSEMDVEILTSDTAGRTFPTAGSDTAESDTAGSDGFDSADNDGFDQTVEAEEDQQWIDAGEAAEPTGRHSERSEESRVGRNPGKILRCASE